MALMSNGGFETGDFTDWDYVDDSWTVAASAARTGSYGVKFYSTIDGWMEINRMVDLTDKASITGYFNVESYLLSNSEQYIQIAIDLYEVPSYDYVGSIFNDVYTLADLPPEGWVQFTFDTSALTGTYHMKVQVELDDGTGGGEY